MLSLTQSGDFTLKEWYISCMPWSNSNSRSNSSLLSSLLFMSQFHFIFSEWNQKTHSYTRKYCVVKVFRNFVVFVLNAIIELPSMKNRHRRKNRFYENGVFFLPKWKVTKFRWFLLAAELIMWFSGMKSLRAKCLYASGP